ncbi:hypothetical protein ARMSODRAFT_977816 [Armillaria solidipes]|uniref:Uncharacterized protein n=1 Tax=Armillaria solidipes TaxID=1076256 RepID=A0A2H3B5N5_9AGAR|nr:hypothetical protein ARMSODRAFT_977816 [Armillaria solidipes]
MHPRTDFRFRFLSPIWQVLVGRQTNTAGEEHTPFIENPRPTAGYEYQRSRWFMGEPPSLALQSQVPHRAIVLSDLVTIVGVRRLPGRIAIFLVFTRRRIVTGSAVPEGTVQFQHSHRKISLWGKSDDQREWDSSRLSTQDSSNYPYNSRDTGASWATSLRFCKRASCAELVLIIWRQFWVLSVPPGVYPEPASLASQLSLLCSSSNGLGKVSANGLHLPEVGVCILDSKRNWNPHEEVNNEEATPPSKKSHNAHPPVLGTARALRYLWQPSLRSTHFSDMPTEK